MKEEAESEKSSITELEHQGETSGGAGGGGGGGGGTKGKSCKGCLYYSSTLKSNASNPRCFGIPRSLPQVPNYIIGQSEVEVSKEGRTLSDFYYACAGYSVYLTNDASSSSTTTTTTTDNPNPQFTKTQLPVCMGLELLVDRRVVNADNASTPPHVLHHKNDDHEFPQRRIQRPAPAPAHSGSDEFLNRFSRNARLVASGVARNMRRVGNQIKETVDDILYPYRRRPK